MTMTRIRGWTAILTVLALCLFQVTAATQYTSCGNYFKIKGVQIEGCTKEPCIFHCGNEQTVSITFDTQSFDINAALRKNIFLLINGAKVPVVNIIPEDPCSRIKCPLAKNYTATYRTSFLIDKVSPRPTGTFHLDLKTADKNETIMCIEINVQLHVGELDGSPCKKRHHHYIRP